MDIEQDIRQFITDNFMIDDGGSKLSGDQSFLDSGIIDSTGILELVSFIEERYSITIEDEELVPDNLDSVNNLVRFVGKKIQD